MSAAVEEAGAGAGDAGDDARRLAVELDFVQCLASPLYLHFLAQNGYLESPPFLRYLDYLTYWKEAEYAQLLEYPHCLAFLDMLIDSELFRKQLKHAEMRDFVHQEQFKHWRERFAEIGRAPATGVEVRVPPTAAQADAAASAPPPGTFEADLHRRGYLGPLPALPNL